MPLESVAFSVLLTFIICILLVKSDPSQLPPEQKEVDLITLFFQDNNFRDQVFNALRTTEIRATQELLLISYYREVIRERIQNIQRVINPRPQNQTEPSALVEELRSHLVVIVERTRGGATIEQLIEYRRVLALRLRDLYNLQERATRRSEFNTLINHLNRLRQYEQQHRQPPLKDQAARERLAKDERTYDQLEQDIRTRIQNLQQHIDRDQPLDNIFQALVNIVVDLWIDLQTRASLLKERRKQERLAEDLRMQRLRISDQTSTQPPKDTRRINSSYLNTNTNTNKGRRM